MLQLKNVRLVAFLSIISLVVYLNLNYTTVRLTYMYKFNLAEVKINWIKIKWTVILAVA